MNKFKKCQHSKGGIYTYLGVATHSETGEELVVYLSEELQLWVRPAEMFFENVIVDGKEVPRFREIEEG